MGRKSHSNPPVLVGAGFSSLQELWWDLGWHQWRKLQLQVSVGRKAPMLTKQGGAGEKLSPRNRLGAGKEEVSRRGDSQGKTPGLH